MEGLKDNRRLEKLNFGSKRNSHFDILDSVIEFVANNTNLKSLSLNGHSSEHSIFSFSQHLQRNTTLKYLSLTDSKIDCKQVKFITDALGKNSSLKKLALTRNNIKSEGAKHIAELMKINKIISKVNISSNNIDIGVQHILEAMKINSSIIELEGFSGDEGKNEEYINSINEIVQNNKKNKVISAFPAKIDMYPADLIKMIEEVLCILKKYLHQRDLTVYLIQTILQFSTIQWEY
eukprot:TRINITY_DN10228_c0_g1_i2.p1 TRINITY_DN10228_c0_g1~~TRINITY_DN10228_c0_g1_i2.p1  ORF type:complete len:235 (-),score=60.95 TRINITY_DN10228_c0_g1_i2:245-949(-)